MPIDKDLSVEDEAYLATVAVEPKMTMDEVGADIDEHGHIPVNHEPATIDPFSAKGALAYALDEDVSSEEAVEHATDDSRDETKGEVEGTTSTPQGLIQTVELNKVDEGLEPTIQQDKAVCVKDSLAGALDAVTMDGAEEIEAKPPVGKDPEPDYAKYSEEDGSHVPLKAPEIPTSMGGDDDKPDENGLVYVSATFTVDPDKYVSNNYRPANMGKMPDAAALLKQKSGAMNTKAANPEEEAAISDLGTPEAKESAASPDEPTEQQEKAAAKEADKEQQKELEAEEAGEGKHVIPTAKGDKQAADAAPESVVLDYATFIDGSSFICYDEVADIDYSKIAMDAGPKKPPTRANCQTTFAQCRAKNPLFCRFHGPKLLEADIKGAIKATVGAGCVVQVTKDKNSKNKFTFRLTVGCPPSKKKMVEKMVHMYLTQNPGISSSTEDWNLVGKHKQTTEFEMDILQADKPPKKDTIASQALSNTKMAKMMHKKQAVVGETAPALEKKAEKGEKWETIDEAVENEWADLVDKNVHKSLLGNNAEFLHNFDEIANQFDEAHDKGDAEGLKKALEALKAEIGKYDENGEKKPEAAATETGEPEAKQTQAKGQTQVSNQGKGDASEEKAGVGETVVLPAPNAASSDKGAESSQPPTNATVKQTPNSKANELSSKLSNFKTQLDGMIESGADAESVNAIKTLLSDAQFSYDKLAAQYEDIAVLDAKAADVAETDDIFGKKLIEDAKGIAEGNADKLLAELESKVGGIETALTNAAKKGQDVKKGKIADEVEETIKGLSAYVYGGKRPPRGVDSVTDYLDYKKDEMESAGEGYSLSPEEMAKMEDTYHLNESYDATKAASNAMDAAVAEFKDLMDSTPGQGEDNESYMKKVEEAQKKIKAASAELMANFDAYKQALEKGKYDVEAAKKLAEAKKKLEGGGDEKPMSELHGIIDLAEKKGQQAQGAQVGEKGMMSDLSDKVGNPFEGLQSDIKPLISNVLSKNGGFTNFDTFNDTSVEGTKHFIEMEKKQKEGYDEDDDEESTPTPEELDKLLKQMNEEFSMYGLQVSPSTKMKNFGKKVYFEVEKLDGGKTKQEQAHAKKQALSDEQKKAIIAAMSPKQKLEAAVKIFKKKLSSNPNDAVAKAKLAKYEAMLSKL